MLSKAQASIDLLISYGISMLIIAIALYVVLQLGVFNPQLAPEYCNASPSFSCAGSVMATNGILTIIFSQSTGGTMDITGIACSTVQNSLTIGPAYGDINVLPYSAASNYYPSNAMQNGIIAYSGSSTEISIYCYSQGGLAKGNIGNGFSGTVWINYTLTDLPNTMHNVQQLATLSTKYA